MDEKTGSIIYNISIALKGNVRAAKELLSAYVAGGRAAVIGREELVGAALHSICVYTGDDHAYEHYLPVCVPGLLSDSRTYPIRSASRNDYYLAEKEKITGRLSFSKQDGKNRITKGDDEIMAWIYVSDDGDVPDAEESLLRGRYTVTTQTGVMNVIYPGPESVSQPHHSPHIHKRPAGSRRGRHKKGEDISSGNSVNPAYKKRGMPDRSLSGEGKEAENGDIPVLIMDDEMVSLNKPHSLTLGALAAGLKDSFQDINSDSGKPQDFEFMQDMCGFVFTHGIIERYQKNLGAAINNSDILSGSADGSWLSHLQSMSRAAAVLDGRNYVLPSDVDFAALSVSSAHISVTSPALAQGHTLFREIQKLTESIIDPDEKERN
jgi:hypothetical protein